jgi:acyl-CoA reductase-like NAD-dependent aldehyde dehydrogenase
MSRLDVTKTYKLFVGGAFPRSESGRSWAIAGRGGDVFAHLCLASRKDLRDAVEIARNAQTKWASATAYNRGQVLYRLAEMLEGKRAELVTTLHAVRSGASEAKSPVKARKRATEQALSPEREVSLAIDRVVHYAGWCDKYSQLLGCHNPVSGQFYNFTVPEATGVVVVVAPDAAPLLGLLSLMLPVLVPGNAAIVLPSEVNPVASMVLAEALATSDMPGGTANILTGKRAELLSFVTSHREIDGVLASCAPSEAAQLREGSAENLKRVCIVEDSLLPAGEWASDAAQGLAWIKPCCEFKTIWHPAIA